MSRIVAVASGKGGVGKTWLAVTLAHALARRRRRVLLFDGDLGLANVDVQLGLAAGPDLGLAVAGRCRLDDVARPFAPGGFDVVPGRSGSGSLAGLDPSRLDALTGELRALAADYDDVVLDLAAGIGARLQRFAASADELLVVTTHEPTAITDAYAFIKIGARDPTRARPRVVVNMAESALAGGRTYGLLAKACVSFLRLEPPLAGIVRRDPKVADAIRHQTPLLVRHPSSPAALDVEALARALAA